MVAGLLEHRGVGLLDMGIEGKKAVVSERDWIRQLKRRASFGRATGARASAIRLGIGDDAAILRVAAGQELLVTTDFSLEGVHFRRDWHSPEHVGHRCLVRGLSDMAAMGAKPLAAFLSLALPANAMQAGNTKGRSWADRFLDGFLASAKRYGVELAGGDFAESPSQNMLADVVLTGTAPVGRALLRSSARAGDSLYVSGELGGAAVELARFCGRADSIGDSLAQPAAAHAYPQKSRGKNSAASEKPEPRLALGQALLRHNLRIAAIDLSDGLAIDLSRLCEASSGGGPAVRAEAVRSKSVRAEIDASRLPVAAGATLDQALYGGEDYELLFTAPPDAKLPGTLGGVSITRIGSILAAGPASQRNRAAKIEKTARQIDRPQIELLAADGRRTPVPPRGWEYFRAATIDSDD